MPIQNPETEFLWKQVFEPVISDTGFHPIRIDKPDDGKSIHSRIAEYLTHSPLIVADLSLSRPNCYFEIGFTMGKNKYTNLILCCREDHNPDSQRYDPATNKIHFDVYTYPVIWWREDELGTFRSELRQKILHRKEQLLQSATVTGTKRRTSGQQTTTSDALTNLLQSGSKELSGWKKQN